MPWKSALSDVTSGAKELGGSTDILAIVVTVLPVVHRLVAILKDLQPEIKAWVRAQADRSEADTHVAESITELSKQLVAALDALDKHHHRLEELLEQRDAKE